MRHGSVIAGFIVSGVVTLLTAPCGAQDRYFDADGVRLRYTDRGTGDPVVLVHGFSNRLELWTTAGIAQDLARDHRVIAFDLRGHGRSDKPRDPGRYGREMTVDIVRLLDHLGIRRAHIVGYSLGAHLTSQLLTLHPERFLSATLIAGAGRFDWDGAKARQADTVATEIEHDCISRSLIRRLAAPTAQPPEDTLKALSTRCLADSAQDRFALAAATRSWAGQAFTPAAAAAVKVPTLALVGSEDPQRLRLEALVAVRPSVKLVIIDGATHGGAGGILARPEALVELRAFLSRGRSPTRTPSSASHAVPSAGAVSSARWARAASATRHAVGSDGGVRGAAGANNPVFSTRVPSADAG